MGGVRASLLAVACLVACAASGGGASAAGETVHAPSALREDLRRLTGALVRHHPHLHRYLAPAEFDRLVERTDAAFGRPMTASAFVREARPLVAAVRCLHTSLRAPDPPAPGDSALAPPILPLRVLLAGRRLYVGKDLPGDPPVPAGSEILAIDGRESREIIDGILAGISCDGWNETYRIWRFHHGPPGVLIASFLGYPATYDVLIAGVGAAGPVLRRIPARALPDLAPPKGKRLAAANDVELSPPQNLQNGGRWAVLAVRRFPRARSARFSAALADAFRTIEEQRIDRLVLDVRGNLGGAPENAADLLGYLSPEPFVYFTEAIEAYASLKRRLEPHATRFRGRLLVLMDGGCASTTGHLLALIRHHGLGILIGEESAGSFTCNDNSAYVVLPNTGSILRVARSEFRVAVTGLPPGRGVPPDVPVEISLADRLREADPAMDRAVRLLAGRRGGTAHATWGRPSAGRR